MTMTNLPSAFVDEATLNELVTQRTSLLAHMPELDKAIKAGLATDQQKADLQAQVGKIEQILRVYRPGALSPAATRRQ